ncbi:hypothetical protein B0O99DRAFT_680601 [Bisporella sp. PMI_857]|nr:hypothetical protein B0O99DRAFT_680601 [Bisporella sp. PMI_857]
MEPHSPQSIEDQLSKLSFQRIVNTNVSSSTLPHKRRNWVKPKNVWAITCDAAGSSAQRLISRWPGINIVPGDLNKPDAICKYLGSLILPRTAVFLAQAHGPTELAGAKDFIDAAASHGVAYFVYSSVDRGGRELSDTDPSYCKTFSDKFYIEQHLKSVAGRKGGKGDMSWITPSSKSFVKGKQMQIVTTKDIGRWAVEGLVRPDRTGIRNEALSVASDELSFQDIDSIFEKKIGKGVPVTCGWLVTVFIWLMKDFNTMFRFINERDYGVDLPWMKERLEPTTFAQWVDTIKF